MRRSQTVRATDVRAMLRLMAELAEAPPDPAARSRHLMDGLCRLVGARAGTDVISRRINNGPKKGEVCSGLVVAGLTGDELSQLVDFFQEMDLGDPVAQWVYAQAEAGATHTRTRRQIVDDRTWRESGHYYEVRKPCGIFEPLIHCCPAGDGRNVRTISLHRDDPDKPFSERDAALVRLFMAEAMRLLTPAPPAVASQPQPADTPPVSDVTMLDAIQRLSPRQRDVLDGLLAGLTIKQIAFRLGLSHHTVGDYVKQIYSRLGVGSRNELTARFVVNPSGRWSFPSRSTRPN